MVNNIHSLTETDIRSYIAQRLANGDTLAEDLPAVMTRYGLMQPSDFVNEMAERMALDNDDEEPEAKPRVVALYEVEKGYGGPEEGGWWYDAGRLVEGVAAVVCHTREEVAAACDKLRAYAAECRMNLGRHKPGSVLCHGWIEPRNFAGTTPPPSFPSERPQYE